MSNGHFFLVAFFSLPFLHTVMDKTYFRMKLEHFAPSSAKKRALVRGL